MCLISDTAWFPFREKNRKSAQILCNVNLKHKYTHNHHKTINTELFTLFPPQAFTAFSKSHLHIAETKNTKIRQEQVTHV